MQARTRVGGVFKRAKKQLRLEVLALLALPANTTEATFTKFIENPETGYLDSKFIGGFENAAQQPKRKSAQPALQKIKVQEDLHPTAHHTASDSDVAGLVQGELEMRTRAGAPTSSLKDAPAAKRATPRNRKNGVCSCCTLTHSCYHLFTVVLFFVFATLIVVSATAPSRVIFIAQQCPIAASCPLQVLVLFSPGLFSVAGDLDLSGSRCRTRFQASDLYLGLLTKRSIYTRLDR